MRRAGFFYSLLFALTLAAGALLRKTLDTDYDSGVLTLIFNAFGMGSRWLVTSCMKGGNDLARRVRPPVDSVLILARLVGRAQSGGRPTAR